MAEKKTDNGIQQAGWWSSRKENDLDESFREAIYRIQEPCYAVLKEGKIFATRGGCAKIGKEQPNSEALPVVAFAPPCCMERLGDLAFCKEHGLCYPYIAGAMAHGINSVKMVESLANKSMLSFFGSAGLTIEAIDAAIEQLKASIPTKSYGFNLIYSPGEPKLEEALVNLYIKKGIRLIEASAYMDLTLPLVRYRLSGIYQGPDGIVAPNKIIAKVSRVELAEKFFAPPPEKLVQALVEREEIDLRQAEMARHIPVAQDLTVEADSGGHTDNRPAIALVPTIIALRDRMQDKYGFPLRIGMAGGIATPAAAAAAFSMGVAYIVTGSVNQACVESGTSNIVREMLAKTQQADVIMAHAGDMFEMGVKVQVIKRGTLFAMRSAKLYDIYQNYDSIENIPASVRDTLEEKFFRASFDKIWANTREYFEQRDNRQIVAADKNPKHKMALVFRWYLGQASHWAVSGDASRKIDYQIWCGPAMGAFNEWARGSFLEKTKNREVAIVALNIIYGAAVLTRINALRYQGVPVEYALNPVPMRESQIKNYLE